MAHARELVGFRAENILGGLTYDLTINGKVVLIVGPNGSGKSTFLNLFYLMLSRQWNRLLEYKFSKLIVVHSHGFITLTQSDLLSLDSESKTPVRLRRYIEMLSAEKLLHLFISKQKLTKENEEKVSSLLGVERSEIERYRRYLREESAVGARLLEIDSEIRSLDLGYILFLPTYRRIEKDLKSIFPDIEDRYRSRVVEGYGGFEREGHFKEIVSFGMEDITNILQEFTRNLNDLSRNESNLAAQQYIGDMVRGEIKKYSIGPIRDISPGLLDEFIDRLDDQLISMGDKTKLRGDLDYLQKRRLGKPSKEMQYLGFFVEKMLRVYIKILQAEAPLRRFSDYVGRYLDKSKSVNYKDFKFSISDGRSERGGVEKETEISLEDLSSGEKQIISVFAYLLLSKKENCLVFIDEPELSLSVPWQKTFLPDIMETGNCRYLFAVTHSPFVFDNQYRSKIIDVRKLRD